MGKYNTELEWGGIQLLFEGGEGILKNREIRIEREIGGGFHNY